MDGRQPAIDADWVRQALAEHETALLRYAYRLTGDLEQARDVVQEAFLRLCLQDAAALDGHVRPWLFRVCRQRAWDTRRKEGRMRTSESLPENGCASREPGPAELHERRDEAGAALRAVAQLPENQQEVVRLKFEAGLSYREISEITGLSVTNVGYLLHTALRRIRGQLQAAERCALSAGQAPRDASETKDDI